MSIRTIRVEKIGGTSMTKFDDILKNVILKDKSDVTDRIIVVSAYGGITNELLEHKKSDKPGVYTIFAQQKNFRPSLEELKKKLFEINHGFKNIKLDVELANQFIEEKINKASDYLSSMEDVLASGYLKLTDILLAARELLASIGESHSAFNSCEILKANGYKSLCVDLSGWGDHRNLTINERVKDCFKDIKYSENIIFATGYTKGVEGIMREFDRGYSEVTFSKIAVEVKAKEAIIHKEYHLCSADPNIVGKDVVSPVGKTNYDVADQLADVGMEAIHPKAAKPLERDGIQLRVRNAFEPDHEGTLITKDYICPYQKTEIIAGSNEVYAVEVHDAGMVGEVGFDLNIMQIFAKYGISYIGKSTNANSICIVTSVINDDLIKELSDKYEVVTAEPLAMVCAIGSNIAKPGVLAKAAGALADAKVNIVAIMQTTRQTNMQFVIQRESFNIAIKALHKALCE
ncbi:MAG: aspartate kinase [Planctomycetota bacterium]|nr:MAG: aspartate kinase [Planctomycetota bacterium]